MKRRSIFAYLLSSSLLIVVGIPTSTALQPNFSNSLISPITFYAALTHGSDTLKSTAVTLPGLRPFNLHVPAVYMSTKPAPLIISLHGYTSSGANQEKYFKLASVASARGILYVAPDGTLDNAGNRFWNATPACCNFYGSTVDDEAYIVNIIDSVSTSYSVDPKRIYIVGH